MKKIFILLAITGLGTFLMLTEKKKKKSKKKKYLQATP
jgi:preprotein translocase subunit YajC